MDKNILLYLIPSVILLFLIMDFEWKNFFKKLGVPEKVRNLNGRNDFQDMLIFLLKISCALLFGFWQALRFSARCAWKMSKP